MDTTLQQLIDDIQAKINSKQIPGADPTKVLAADEADIMTRTVEFLDVLNTPADSNFEPYDPAKTYSNIQPDYVSHEGNTWEYVNATPAAGIEPGTSADHWVSVSAGTFAHQQNTDTGTNSTTFEIGKLAAIIGETTGTRTLIFGGPDPGKKAAIRQHWIPGESSGTDYTLEYTADYTGTGSDVWVEFEPRYTDSEAIAAAKTNIGTGATNFAAGTLVGTVSGNTSNIAANTASIASNTAAIDTKANKALAIVSPVANYTLDLSDASNMVRMNMATANTLTIPPDASVAFPTGTQIVLSQAGTGQTTIQGGSGVTVNSYAGKFKTAGQYAGVTMVKTGANLWTIYGNLSS